MANVVLELARSADWAAGVVFVNGHGGNHSAVTRAVARLTAEGRNALAWWPKWPQRNDGGPSDLHAGRIETSLMLAIDPGLVRFELAEAGPDAAIDELAGARRPRGQPVRRARRSDVTHPAGRANGSSRCSSKTSCTRSRSGARSTRRRTG